MVDSKIFKSWSRFDLIHSKHPFSRLFLEEIAQFGDRIAVIDPESRESLTFNELGQRVLNTSSILKEFAKKGETWATICGNSIEFLVFVLASNSLGLSICPLNPALKFYEIQKYVEQAKCSKIVLEGRFLERHEADLRHVFEEESIFTLSQFITDSVDGDRNEETSIGEDFEKITAFVFFSSGTSGPPKAVELDNPSLIGLISQIKSFPLSEGLFPFVSSDDVIHGVLPWFHAGGMLTLFTMLIQGASVIINDRFDPQHFLKIIQDFKVSVLNVVPPILGLLSSSPLIHHFNLKSLRLIYVGAARVEAQMIENVKNQLNNPSLEITQLYGMTEAGLLIFMTPKMNEKLDSVGLAVPGVEFKILDDSGNSVEIGAIGNLWLKTPCLLAGYRGSDSQPVSADGWFDSGDLARVDENQFVFIEGRTKEMIKVKGWQVSPYELEEAINTHFPKEITDCAVVGVPAIEIISGSETAGYRPFAFIVGSKCDPDQVIQFIATNFISYKHLLGASLIDELPRTASGKLCRHKLIEAYINRK